VLFDQRGCGRSRPHASDPAADMSVNTTHHLIADMERLREHLGVDQWLLWGGSWGSTLALAYAEAHPDRVSGIVLVAVTTSRRYEIDWLYRGVGRFFPAAWREFLAGAACGLDDDVVAAYAALMEHPDAAVRAKAALDWATWEDAVVGHEPGGKPDVYRNRPPDALLAFVRICAHYFAAGAWLEEGQILREAPRLSGIPGALIHGRLDMSASLDTAWELAQAWPDAELTVIDTAGHQGNDAMRDAIRAAVDRLSPP